MASTVTTSGNRVIVRSPGPSGGVTSVMGRNGAINSLPYIVLECSDDTTKHKYKVVKSGASYVLQRETTT